MANTIGMINISSSLSAKAHFKKKTTRANNRVRIYSVSASATISCDPYRTLRIRPDASKTEVKKSFRQFALQIVISQLREESRKPVMDTYEFYNDGTEEVEIGMKDPNSDLWEEWMGWEGAGICDYSSHINPYL